MREACLRSEQTATGESETDKFKWGKKCMWDINPNRQCRFLRDWRRRFWS